MTTSERPYWRTSILNNRLFHNDRTKDSEAKTKIKQEDLLQSSLLHSARLKKNLEESRKAFFNMKEQVKNVVRNSEEFVDKTILKTRPEVGGNKKVSAKKISFKIKKTSSIYRKNSNNSRITTVSANSVAELTSRFNKLVTTKNVIDDSSLSKLVNKVNNQFINSLKNKEDASSNALSRSKLKSDEQQPIYFIRRPSVKRKTSMRKFADVNSAKNKPEVGKVKATIEIFETITSRVSPTNENNEFPSLGFKPKVPEKKFGPEVIDIVNKNKERSSRFLFAHKQQQKDTNSDDLAQKNDTSALAASVNKIIIAQTLDVDSFDDPKTDFVQVVNIPIITKRCDSKYETLNVSKVSPKLLKRRTNVELPKTLDVASKSIVQSIEPIKIPNKSFLWSRNMPEYPQIKLLEQLEELYDKVDPISSPKIPPRPNHLNLFAEDKIYEDVVRPGANYEYCTSSTKYEELDDGYEYCQNGSDLNEDNDNIYETLPTPKKSPTSPNDNKPTIVPPNLPPKKQQVPLPPRPPSRNPSFYSVQMDQEKISNCYESIYNASSKRFDLDSNYESIDECLLRVDQLSVWGSVSNASSDDKSNSLYVYGKCQSDRSDRSASDRTDEWVDLSDDNEQEDVRQDEVDSIVLVREKPKIGKRNSGWSQKCREQRKKAEPTHLFDEDGNQTTGRMRKQPPLPPRRRHVADTVYITSTSNVYILHQDKDMDDITRTLREYAGKQNKYQVKKYNKGDITDNISIMERPSDIVTNNHSYNNWGRGRRRGSNISDFSNSDSVFSSLSSDCDSRTVLKNRSYCGLGEEVQEISFFIGDTDSDHIYESLCGTTPKEKESSLPQQTAEEENDVYDSFDSDSDCDYNIKKDTHDITNAKLPQLPINQTSVSTIAKTLRKNFTKSFHKMTKRRSEPADLNTKSNLYQNITFASTTNTQIKPSDCQNTSQINNDLPQPNADKITHKKGSIFNKFRRSMTFVSDSFISESTPTTTDPLLPSSINSSQRPKSTFYLTDAIDLSVADDLNSCSANRNKDYTTCVLISKAKSSLALPLRPQNPPPPAPNQPPNNHSNTAFVDPPPNNNQLYTDCGLFKPDVSSKRNKNSSNTNWYADVGLYQQSCDVTSMSPTTSNSSSAENSGGTTASAVSFNMNDGLLSSDKLKHLDEDEDRLHDREEYYNMRNEMVYCNDDTKTDIEAGKSQRWLDEPLYQFYDAAILESEYKNSTENYDYDGYEEVGKIRPTAMELIAPIKNSIGAVSRTLWCEVPEVLQSAVLSSLSETQQKIQEAKFEMLTSEASYFHSLNVLVDHFVKNIKHSELLTDHESKLLFGNIFAVKDCAEKLLADLEKCWQDNILLTNICDIVNKHAEDNFHVYVTFCENQIFLDSTLNKLKERLSFSRYLEQLERSAACHSLKLNSFLLLPMQRITRWRLLVDAVLKRLVVEDDEYMSSRNTMATLTKIAQQCNEAARNMERTLEIQQISKQLEFAKGVPPVDILDNGSNSVNRFLIKSGPLTQMVAKTSDLKVTFGKRFTKIPLYLFLFNDILLITKARSKDNYLVLHYCYRNFIEVNTEDSLESLPLKNAQGRHLIFLTILENHEEKLVELLLSCDSVSDKERWLEAILPPKSENPDEIIYENWDCPQVTAVHNYAASQPDEMSLVKGDVINVDKKLTDGWYHGEKISDNQIGWFPSNYTITITNQHVRARNLKMRYRLLAFSTNYILNNQ